MKFLIPLMFVALLMAAGPAPAAVTGAELLSRCEAAEKSMDGEKLSGDAMLDAMWCMGYMSGLLDGFSVGDYRVGNAKAVCPPEEGVSRTQALRVVSKWLREHPEAQQKNGRRGAVLALTSAYPCK
jgi:hypothetical protein